MTEEERIMMLLQAMQGGQPGSPLLGGMGMGGLGRIAGKPSAAAGFVRGGFGNRSGGGFKGLGFSPYAAQVAQGKANLQAPTNAGIPSPPGLDGAPPPGWQAAPPHSGGQSGQGAAPQDTGAQYADPGQTVNYGNYTTNPYGAQDTGDVLDANTLMRLLGRSRYGGY